MLLWNPVSRQRRRPGAARLAVMDLTRSSRAGYTPVIPHHPAPEGEDDRMLHDDLNALLGREHALDDLNRALCRQVRRLEPTEVGAMHITCADESEWECVHSFQQSFVRHLLPPLKHAEAAPFRLSNLGGRYEWGALAVAENHFATGEAREHFKVLLTKVNAHVGVLGNGADQRFGKMARYDGESTACGALHALMAGGERPFLDDLREALASDNLDRLTALLDDRRVDPQFRSLAVALVNARLQTRRVELDIHRHRAAGPTLYLIASVVTLNRPGPDTELFCGWFTGDYRTDAPELEYRGLGDDPTRYRYTLEGDRLLVSED